MIVAGLALAAGLEEFVINKEREFRLPLFDSNAAASTTDNIILWAFFIVFLSTVVRFVHGAMRHFDIYYIEKPEGINWRGQPLWDFFFLGFEAFIFFVLAFSLYEQTRFVTSYLVLLVIDSVWLIGVFFTHIKKVWSGTPRNWIIANLIVLGSTGIPWIWYHNDNTRPLWLLIIFLITVLIHSIMDYWKNWEFYFGKS